MFAQTRSWQAARCHPARGSRRVLTRCGAELGTGRAPRLHLFAHVARRGGWFCVAAEGKMRGLGDGRVCLDPGVLLECHSLCRTPFPPQQTRGASSARSAQAPGRGAQVRGTGRRHWAQVRGQVPGRGAQVRGAGAGVRGAGAEPGLLRTPRSARTPAESPAGGKQLLNNHGGAGKCSCRCHPGPLRPPGHKHKPFKARAPGSLAWGPGMSAETPRRAAPRNGVRSPRPRPLTAQAHATLGAGTGETPPRPPPKVGPVQRGLGALAFEGRAV